MEQYPRRLGGVSQNDHCNRRGTENPVPIMAVTAAAADLFSFACGSFYRLHYEETPLLLDETMTSISWVPMRIRGGGCPCTSTNCTVICMMESLEAREVQCCLFDARELRDI